MGPLTELGFLEVARLIAEAKIRNAARIVDFPALLGPTRTLKCRKSILNDSNALNLLKETRVI
jgi:hypothetical protein